MLLLLHGHEPFHDIVAEGKSPVVAWAYWQILFYSVVLKSFDPKDTFPEKVPPLLSYHLNLL